jgi:hypothetical protein
MVPERRQGATQDPVAGNSFAIRPQSIAPNAHARVMPKRTTRGYGRLRQTTYPICVSKAVISVAVIDEKLFTRECITKSLQALDERFDILSFATCDECLQHIRSHDLILYHAREAVANWDTTNQQFLSLIKLLKIVPVIILSDVPLQARQVHEMFLK